MKRLYKIIGAILILGVILVCLPIVIPKLMGFQEYNVISGSMEPEIPVGSLVYVKPADFSELGIGDVIAFSSGASVVTHRIVDIDSDNLLITTKGDANSANDFMPVAYTNVLGRVLVHIPVLGSVAALLTETSGKAVAVVVLLVGVFFIKLGEKNPKVTESATDGTLNSSVDNLKGNTASNNRINPKVVLALGMCIIIGACGGIFYIYNGYEKSESLYESLANEYITVTESSDWQDMIEVDFDRLTAINSDVIGWIYVEGTDISYPIMYSGDDETYLHTMIDGNYAKAGSVFLEGANSSDFSDSHSIIYGHNMRNLSMFGTLKYYKSDENYLDEHRYFQVITPTGKMRFEIFSYFDTEPASWVYGLPYSDSDEFQDYINRLITHSYRDIDTDEIVDSDDQIITLSTCSSSGMRFTVHGYMVARM